MTLLSMLSKLFFFAHAINFLLYQFVEVLKPRIRHLIVEIFSHGYQHIVGSIRARHIHDVRNKIVDLRKISLWDCFSLVIRFLKSKLYRNNDMSVRSLKSITLSAYPNFYNKHERPCKWNRRPSSEWCCLCDKTQIVIECNRQIRSPFDNESFLFVCFVELWVCVKFKLLWLIKYKC